MAALSGADRMMTQGKTKLSRIEWPLTAGQAATATSGACSPASSSEVPLRWERRGSVVPTPRPRLAEYARDCREFCRNIRSSFVRPDSFDARAV